ncbi:MAG: family 14 glycosylhydrolase [Deltaproteobacteria bacterium]|nr:family 14 glycosylhydrolase [Deltaproteobacteria bacterium]
MMRPSIVQQWQYKGLVPNALLENHVFEECKRAGITALQSYVTWAEIEKIKGRPDFSTYDPLVERLSAHGLKWVPFLIAGPNYATPSWFHRSSKSLYAVCLEHGRQSKIQSIWNPRLPIHIKYFIQLFAEHYNSPDLFDTILLGVSGNWGEAIFPAFGGFHPNFHAHPGWWCGDTFALSDFRQHVMDKYGGIQVVNQLWETSFTKFSDITFPAVNSSTSADMADLLIRHIPQNLRPFFSFGNSMWTKWIGPAAERLMEKFKRTAENTPDIGRLHYRLDFTRWYRDAMTRWAEFWLKTAREYFPENDIQLVTGGESSPESGADFSGQAAAAASVGGGIRITNQNDDYAQSFILTRLAASACKNYRASFSTEEAGVNHAYGVTMRIFDGITTGVSGLYFKGLMGCGHTPCGKQGYDIGKLTAGAENLRKYTAILSMPPPLIKVAVFYPDTDVMVRPETRKKVWHRCRKLRRLIDFDMIDERMVMDGHILNYSFLLVLEGEWITSGALSRIASWVKTGGILLFYGRAELTPIDKPATESIHVNAGKSIKFGSGHAWRCPKDLKTMEEMAGAVYNREHIFEWTGIPDIPVKILQRFYATRFFDKILAFDPVLHRIEIFNAP